MVTIRVFKKTKFPLIIIALSFIAILLQPGQGLSICGRKSCIVPDNWSPPSSPKPSPSPQPPQPIPGPSPRSPQQASTESNNKGVEYHNQGNYEMAIWYYEEALELWPDNQVAKKNLRMAKASQANELGNEYYKKGDWNNAIKSYEQALKYAPDVEVIQENLRNTRAIVKRLAENDSLRREANRKNEEAKAKLDNMLDSLAEDLGSSGTRVDSTPVSDSPGFMGSSEPLFSKGTKSSAPVDLRFANPSEPLTVHPEDMKGTSIDDQVHKLTGDALMEMSLCNYSGAVSDLGAALRLKPNDRELQILLGEALYQRDKRNGKKGSPKADILLDAVEYGKGDWNSSIRYLEAALAREKNEEKAQVLRDVRNHIEALNVMDEKQHSAKPKTTAGKLDSPFSNRLYEVYGEKIGILLEKRNYKAALYIAAFATIENPDSEAAREMYYRVFFMCLGSLKGTGKESQ